MSLTPRICHLCGIPKKRDRLWKPGAFSQLFRVNNWDKTLTVRHRETPDREDKQSEGHLVMRWIAVATLPQVKAALTFIWCLMARSFTEPMN